MIRTAWFIYICVEFCHSYTDTGCCGQNDNGSCWRCCNNYELIKGNCRACEPGSMGVNCSIKCMYPHYGEFCIESCSTNALHCSKEDCDPASGCMVKETSVTSYIAQTVIMSSSQETSAQGNNQHNTINGEIVTTKRKEFSTPHVSMGKNTKSNSPEETSVPRTINTKQTTSSIRRPSTRKSPESVKDLTSESWLISVVGVLGISLGVSLVVILGLVCLFVWKKRQDSTIGKSTNTKHDGRQRDLETNMYSCEHMDSKEALTLTEAEIGTSVTKQSYRESSEYQTLCAVSPLRKSDERGRSDAPSHSTDTYMEPVTREGVTIRTIVDNPSYVEVIP
ncbi:uncharacterized protein LOC134242461 [Saccostrea cucullata]|uniref:uncharacterized protein LOC134242461 n=1 Tax=Saccostrea cuccullata TaxID=36930 RepID=UPI002ED2E904